MAHRATLAKTSTAIAILARRDINQVLAAMAIPKLEQPTRPVLVVRLHITYVTNAKLLQLRLVYRVAVNLVPVQPIVPMVIPHLVKIALAPSVTNATPLRLVYPAAAHLVPVQPIARMVTPHLVKIVTVLHVISATLALTPARPVQLQ